MLKDHGSGVVGILAHTNDGTNMLNFSLSSLFKTKINIILNDQVHLHNNACNDVSTTC